MMACAQWYRTDFLRRAGYLITTREDGSRQAQGQVTFPLPPHCGHPECPPIDREEADW